MLFAFLQLPFSETITIISRANSFIRHLDKMTMKMDKSVICDVILKSRCIIAPVLKCLLLGARRN